MLDKAISVSELNEYARRLLAGDPLLRSVQVRGEISGFKHHYSGHCYFVLKDSACRVNCAMFRQYTDGLSFTPKDGMMVTVQASASVFARDGAYQLYVTAIKRNGEGDLYRLFEMLKERLMKEGLFDPARKRQIPFFPHTIGVATSGSGAAIHDIIRVARRRDPNIDIIFAPCQVQGEGAAEDIARAIRLLNRDGRSEVLLVGRGGGSMEDLWCFNEEVTARAIADSAIPVISCVGHEVDFTIADFVADVRAATPSAAAEIAVAEKSKLRGKHDDLTRRLHGALTKGQTIRRAHLEKLTNSGVFRTPEKMLTEAKRAALDRQVTLLHEAMRKRQTAGKAALEKAAALLAALDPGNVLTRGYAVVKDTDGHILKGEQLFAGQDVRIVFSETTATARVGEVNNGNE